METSTRQQSRGYDGERMTGRRSGPAGRGARPAIAPAHAPNEGSVAFRVGILDRDSGFVVVLAKRLERAGGRHHVLPAKTSVKALASMDIDVLIVDPVLLGARCWSWLERLCEQLPHVGVIVCTGSSTVAERVRALRLGVDDWLSKPCHPEELLARIEAVTLYRRRFEPEELAPLSFGEVEIRPSHFQAFVRGRSLQLTRREYQLIQLLARADGEVLPRESIYESLWGYEMTRNDRSVDVFVHKLRRKLDQASPAWKYIHTHFKTGYRLTAELVEPAAPAPLASPSAAPVPEHESLLAA